MRDPLEKVIRPIVEGQILSFLHDHPEVAAGWRGKRKDGRSKAIAVMNSLAKRISRDLLCPETRVRIVAACVEAETAPPSGDRVEPLYCAIGAGGGSFTAPGVPEDPLP